MSEKRKTRNSILIRAIVFVAVFIASFALTIGALNLNHQRQERALIRKYTATNQPATRAQVIGLPTPAPDDNRLPVANIHPRIRLKIVKVDSEEITGESGSGQNAVDGDASTYWHTEWQERNPTPPHEIVIELIPPALIKGFTYLPRQDSSDHGLIKDYELYVSDDGPEFREPVKKGSFDSTRNLKTEMFEATKARFVKLKALSEMNGLAWTSAAEIGVVVAE